MAVTQRLDLRQQQSLVMTPQLQQAIKLLQLSNLELAAYVEQELERNPLLEREEAGEAAPEDPGAEAGAEAVAEPGAPEPRDSADFARSETLPAAAEAPLDADFENLYDNCPVDDWTPYPEGASAGARHGAFESGETPFEQRVAEAPSLRQHLIVQVQMDLRDPADRAIGLHLIEMLDESGYLVGDLDELAGRLGCGRARIEATLAAVQRFDPTGIFARSLRECLALQLAERDRLDPAMAALLDNLALLARRDLAGLRKACGVDAEDLAEMIAEIRALNPKPAETFDVEVAAPIVPDILMRPTPSGGWTVELNGDTLPRVLVNARYYAEIAGRARDKKDKEYIGTQYQSANWLVRSLHQRATTILKVASEIVRQQDAFFRRGIEHLRPLTLRAIAEAIEMHESTVSRVTSNKYMATPRGLYELKYFFTAAIGGARGESHSAEAVRHRIKVLIEAENGANVLSDDTIVEILRRDGIDIARRTVAKYRDAMRIPSSVQRRRDKALRT